VQGAAPGPAEVAPGIHRLLLPTRSPWLPEVNAYLLRDERGLLLVDCGVGTPEALVALTDQLGRLGHRIEDIRVLLLTHGHYDHVGLGAVVRERAGARVLVHREELPFLDERSIPDRRRRVAVWYRRNGLAEPDDPEWRLPMGYPEPGETVAEGDVLEWGGRRLEVLWTPGHSPGLICLYDAESRVLVTSDHILQRITPHVGLHYESPRNPLRDYLDGLHRLVGLPVDAVLPGHGPPFGELAARIAEIQEHHEVRCLEVLSALSAETTTAAAVAQRLTWVGASDGWSRLDRMNRRSALGEMIAHLRLLERDGRVVVDAVDEALGWRLAAG